MKRLPIATYNIHKGFSQFNRRMVVHELRDRLRALDADIVFLQEVQGLHERHAEAHEDWPDEPQHEFLAEDVWEDHAYGRNVDLRPRPPRQRHPVALPDPRCAQPGRVRTCASKAAACCIARSSVPGWHGRCIASACTLSLFGRSRRRQLDALAATAWNAAVPATRR